MASTTVLRVALCLCVAGWALGDFKFISDKDVDRIEQEWDKEEEVRQMDFLARLIAM